MQQVYPAINERSEVAHQSMKIVSKLLVSLGVLVLVPGFAAQAEDSPPTKHHDITVWVSSKTGSLLGSGYTSTYLTNIRAKTIGKDDPRLRQSIDWLDGLGMLPVKGFGLVPAAVAWQSELPMRKVIEQQAETGLSYGELLMANSLATESGQSFAEIVARRAQTRTWGELADQLHVNPDLLATRARTAARRIIAADSRSRRGPDHQKDNSFTSANPHIQRAVHN